MELGGYADRIARVDLNSGDIKYEGINEEDARKYIGGRGLGVKYVFDNGPSVDPLSPDNILCFLVGPLSGTNVTMSGRMAVVTKSPLTGGVTDSHHGGWSGARLRWAGLDGLIFKWKAAKPVYAYIEGGNVELRDASDLWGKGAHETVKTLLARHGEDVSVISIGQGGENLSRFGNWINENDRASGRGGTGGGRQQEPEGAGDQGQEEDASGQGPRRLQGGPQGRPGRHQRQRRHGPTQGRAFGVRHQRLDERVELHWGAPPRTRSSLRTTTRSRSAAST
jgi:hypothetical protein